MENDIARVQIGREERDKSLTSLVMFGMNMMTPDGEMTPMMEIKASENKQEVNMMGMKISAEVDENGNAKASIGVPGMEMNLSANENTGMAGMEMKGF